MTMAVRVRGRGIKNLKKERKNEGGLLWVISSTGTMH